MKHLLKKIHHHAQKIPHHLKRPVHFVKNRAASFFVSQKMKYFVLAFFFVSAFAMYTAFIIFVFFQNRDDLAREAWGKYGNAELAFELNYKDANIAWQLGNFYFNNTIGRSEYDLDKAEVAFKRVLAIEPARLNANYQLGRIYLVKGDYDKAITHLDREIMLNLMSYRSFYVRGLAYAYRSNGDDLE